MRWRIFLLGPLRVQGDDRTITRFQTRQAGVLLAYLAYYPATTHPRETLIEMLWPECEPTAGRARLSTALSSLRRQLEPPGLPAGPVILADRSHVRLNPAAFTTDVAEFQAAFQDAVRARSGPEGTQRLADVVDRYGHSLLPHYHERWVFEEREALAGQFFQALAQLLAQVEQNGELSRAVQYARRGVAVDPLREEAHYELIRLLTAAGQPRDALRQFDELTETLRRELDIEPAPLTLALARQIRAQLLEEISLPAPVTVPLQRGRKAPARRTLPTGTVTVVLVGTGAAPSQTIQPGTPSARSPGTLPAHLRRLVLRSGGSLIEPAADPRAALFTRASDAVDCAIGVRATFPTATIAIHTGEAKHGDSTYGELLRVATGLFRATLEGQTLLSDVSAALLRHDPNGVARLADLGAYCLLDGTSRDRPPWFGDPAQPPPVATLNAPPAHANHCPTPLDRFFGREAELAAAQRLLPSSRLVTLTGVAGVGKTRLAVESCHRLSEAYGGSAWFVPLAGLSDPELIPDRVLEVAGVPHSPHLPPIDQLISFLARRPCLMILDNFEHLLPDGVRLVQMLLEGVPTLACLVTSRRRLDLPGERALPVPPLPVPEAAWGVEARMHSGPASPRTRSTNCLTPQGLCALAACPSVGLFIDRAQAARADFQITPANASAVAALCTRLEGLPLALELAAARAWVFTPAQMLDRLEHRFELLTSRRRAVDSRHLSLQAALDWSYQLLSPELQRFIAQLSVFRGGWTVDAATEICETPDALDRLEELLSCSLVQAETLALESRLSDSAAALPLPSGPQGAARSPAARFHMLEALREFAALRLEPSQAAALQKRHELYYTALAQQAQPGLYGPETKAWLARLEEEADNFRAALDGLVESGEPARGLELAAPLGRFWYMRGHAAEGRARLAELLAAPCADRCTPTRAEALRAAARLAVGQSDYDAARGFYQDELAIWEALGDRAGEASALAGLGNVARALGRYHTAEALLSKSLALADQHQDPLVLATTHVFFGLLSQGLIDYATARSHYQKGLELYRQQGDVYGVGNALHQLGFIALTQCEYDSSRAFLEEGLRISRELGDQGGIGAAYYQLGHVALQQADGVTARRLFEQSLSIHRGQGDQCAIACVLHSLGEMALHEGDFSAARQFYEEALEIRRAVDSRQGVAWSLYGVGSVARSEGDYRGARGHFEESLALLREVGDRPGVASAIYELGYLALGLGDYETAHQRFQESLPLQRELGGKLGIGASLHGLGEVARHRGNQAAAARHYRDALAVWRGVGFKRGIAGCLEGFAKLAAKTDQQRTAIRWLSTADALRADAGCPRWPRQQQEHLDQLSKLRSALGEPSFADAWEAGRASTWEEAADEAAASVGEF